MYYINMATIIPVKLDLFQPIIRLCRACGKPGDFYKANSYQCKDCLRTLYYEKRWLRGFFNGARRRAAAKGIRFTITLDYLKHLYFEQDGKCKLSGMPFMRYETGKSRRPLPYAPSLDRIFPEDGYVEGNVRFVLWALNMALGEHGLDIYLEIAKAVIEQSRNRH
jgi:hypothetical protein